MPIVKNPIPKPQTYTEAMKAIRKFCRNRCCAGNSMAVLECKDSSCEFWSSRVESEQISFIDTTMRPVFIERVCGVVSEIHGKFTVLDVKEKCRERYNGEIVAVHPNWYGSAMSAAVVRYNAKMIGTVHSSSSKSNRRRISVWWKE